MKHPASNPGDEGQAGANETRGNAEGFEAAAGDRVLAFEEKLGKRPNTRKMSAKKARKIASASKHQPLPDFFDRYDKFLGSSDIASFGTRLNFRYHLIIEQNADLIEGKRILDFASHDGRFSFAALVGGKAGHVTGIEPRENLVSSGRRIFREYGADEGNYDLICGDGFGEITKLEPGSIDTAMVLGFLYHTARHHELFAQLSKLGVKNLIVDSIVLLVEDPVIYFRPEGTGNDGQIWDGGRPVALSSTPSEAALRLLMEEFGYSVRRVETEVPYVKRTADYRNGRRVTLVGTRD